MIVVDTPQRSATAAEIEFGARAVRRCDQLGVPPYSDAPDQLTRAYLTTAHAAALDALSAWMTQAGMTVRLDAAANMIGRYEGAQPGAPALIIGSHIDTVRNGGRYDGALGVMLGVDCVEALSRAGRRLPFAVEVIAFGDEEGSRFPASMGCSRAVAGTVDPAVLAMKDGGGTTLSAALASFGCGGESLASAARRPGEVLGFLEAHIEQGPVLEAEGLPVGIVTAIAAQKRLGVRMIGAAGHAGTTPMALRRDPGPAAAEAIMALERLCLGGADGLVGTVGRVTALPGSFNVIPGTVEVSMDIRAETSATRDAAVEAITAEVARIASARNLQHTVELLQNLAESPCDERLSGLLADAITSVGYPARRLPSGAGHDAMTMAALCPTAMLFIRCKGGVSHNPAEAVELDDARVAFDVMMAFIEALGRTMRW